MKNRKLQMAVLTLVTITGLAASIFYYNANRPRISFGCYQQIEEGMTLQQAEAILGGPPRWEVVPKRRGDLLRYMFGKSFLPKKQWVGTGGSITLFFRDDVVAWKHYEELTFEPRPKTMKEMIFPWSNRRSFSDVFKESRIF